MFVEFHFPDATPVKANFHSDGLHCRGLRRNNSRPTSAMAVVPADYQEQARRYINTIMDPQSHNKIEWTLL